LSGRVYRCATRKKRKKKRTTTTTKLRRAVAALLRGAAAEIETREYKEKQSWSSSHRKSISLEGVKIGAGSWSNNIMKECNNGEWKRASTYGHKIQKHFNRWVLQRRPAHGEYTISLAPWQYWGKEKKSYNENKYIYIKGVVAAGR
jgi:hypothetical protein